MTEEVKYYKQFKCPDCEWSLFRGEEGVGMTPCPRCNSTGYIFEPVDEPVDEPKGGSPADRVGAVKTKLDEMEYELTHGCYVVDKTRVAKEICSLFPGPPICEFCEGTGYLPNDNTGEPNPPVGGFKCPVCNGAGFLFSNIEPISDEELREEVAFLSYQLHYRHYWKKEVYRMNWNNKLGWEKAQYYGIADQILSLIAGREK